MDGTRAAIRTVIRYRTGVLKGKGASLLDGYMEDLATDRIYRLMIAQRMLHHDDVTVTDDLSRPVSHTPEFISELFDRELENILSELRNADEPVIEEYREARFISEQLIRNEEFDPI